MSHYTELECEFDIEHKAEMIAALEEEFGKHGESVVEWHEKGAHLEGYQGDDRSKAPKGSKDYAPPCEVVIRRHNVGSASNDIGFQLLETGKFKAWVSDFDRRQHFGTKRQHDVAMKYSIAVSEKTLKAGGFTEIERVKLDDGSIKIVGKQKIGVATIPLKNW